MRTRQFQIDDPRNVSTFAAVLKRSEVDGDHVAGERNELTDICGRVDVPLKQTAKPADVRCSDWFADLVFISGIQHAYLCGQKCPYFGRSHVDSSEMRDEIGMVNRVD